MNTLNIDKMPFVIESQHIIQVCAPLKSLGITNFIYMRLYSDGRLVDLATHAPWGKQFFENLYQQRYTREEISHHVFFNQRMALWEHDTDNRIWQEGKQAFQLGNGISIFKNKSDFTDIYSFYTHKDNHQINNFYINHITVLEKFIDYFHERAASLIETAEKKPFILPLRYLKNQPENIFDDKAIINKFLTDIKKDNISYKLSAKLLTDRELECLRWLCRGKSSQETSVILNCSKRTIETHIENMKIKLDCNKITSLIYKATLLGLI